MPAPTIISPEAIFSEARSLLEQRGLEGLTMRELARRLGVSAPSLYFHVESRDDLLRLVVVDGLRELGEVLAEPPSGRPPLRERLMRMARAYVDFGLARPQLFALLFGPCPEERQVADEYGAAAAEPVLALSAEIVGEERALSFSAAAWSLVHGYTLLRLADQFRINPEHERSLEYGIDLLLDGALATAGRPG